MPYTNSSAHERQVVFDSHIFFNFKIRNQPCHSLFFNPMVLVPPLQTPRDIERRFNLNLMSMTNELAIKGQINLWLWRITDENPHGHDVGEGNNTDVGEFRCRCAHCKQVPQNVRIS